MKRLILITALFAVASASYAQSGMNDPIYQQNSGSPKEVTTLGRNPEYPFIRNCRTPEEVVAALKKCERTNPRAARHLDKMLMQMGFANGINDLTADNIVAANIPANTTGNMGDGNYGVSYITLNAGDGAGTKAWKISPNNGTASLYLLGRCGNAFYPEKSTACVTAPLTLTNDTKEVTLNNDGALQKNDDKVFVYYHRRKHKRHQESFASGNIPDTNPSRPLMLSKTEAATVLPVTYKISVSSPESTAMVCPDKDLDVTTNINVERESEFTGNYPGASNQYVKVSKHAYKKAVRKMAKVRRKEHKIDRTTGVEMNV